MRDCWGVDARPVAHERDPKGVDPRPGWGSSWVCSVATNNAGSVPVSDGEPTDWRPTRDRRQRAGARGTRMRNQTHNQKRPGVSHRRAVPPSGGGRVVRLPEVSEITGLSRTTIWRRERDGSFPPPFRWAGNAPERWAGGNRTSTTGLMVCPPQRDYPPNTQAHRESLSKSPGQRIHPTGTRQQPAHVLPRPASCLRHAAALGAIAWSARRGHCPQRAGARGSVASERRSPTRPRGFSRLHIPSGWVTALAAESLWWIVNGKGTGILGLRLWLVLVEVLGWTTKSS